MINDSIFRAYDIRGNAYSDLSNSLAYKIGYCFSKKAITQDNNIIVVGRDGRLSSSEFCSALIKGIEHAGSKVIFIGIVPSPMLYFADKKFNAAGSIMVTASHNPKEDNGFKMMQGGQSFFGEMIQELKKDVMNQPNNIYDEQTENIGTSSPKIINITDEYIERIFQNIKINPNLRIAFDPANGSSGEITKLLCEKLNCHTFLINEEIDGNFPAHKPDPTIPENLVQLKELVLTHKCDLGIGYDGDGDRIGVITKNGTMVYGDQLLCIYAKNILDKHPGSTIIADVKASKILFDYIELLGGKGIMWKTGHSFIKSKMQESKALLAGEMSGHIFFADDYYGYDDALYASLRLIDILSSSNKSLDEMLNELPNAYNTPEIRITIEESEKFKIIEKIKQKAKNQGIEFNDIDGLRVTNKNGWWLLRASNTQSAIIARCESNNAEGLKNLKQELEYYLQQKIFNS